MKRVSASTCDCLPDCQSTDLTYSVTSNNFMWIENSIYKIASQFPKSIVYNWASRECDSRNLNLNPLCTLGRGPLPKLWLDGVRCKNLLLKFSLKAISKSPMQWLQILLLKVRKTYGKLSNSTPDYISSLASPMRKRRQDELIANHQVIISNKHFRGNLGKGAKNQNGNLKWHLPWRGGGRGGLTCHKRILQMQF